MPLRACLSTSTAFSIRSSPSSRMSSTLMVGPWACSRNRKRCGAPRHASAGDAAEGFSARDQGADLFAQHGPLDVAIFVEVEHQDWHLVLHALRDGRRV